MKDYWQYEYMLTLGTHLLKNNRLTNIKTQTPDSELVRIHGTKMLVNAL